MEKIGRDKIVQTGDQSTIGIDNHRVQREHKWHKTSLGQIIIGLVILIIGTVLLNFFGFN